MAIWCDWTVCPLASWHQPAPLWPNLPAASCQGQMQTKKTKASAYRHTSKQILCSRQHPIHRNCKINCRTLLQTKNVIQTAHASTYWYLLLIMQQHLKGKIKYINYSQERVCYFDYNSHTDHFKSIHAYKLINKEQLIGTTFLALRQ